MNIGKKIKFFRNQNNLSQEELANKCGLSRNAIYNYENNRRVPQMDVLEKISYALDITINDLIQINDIEIVPVDTKIEYILSDLYQIEVEGNKVFINDKNMDLVLSINEFNVLKNNIVDEIKNKIQFIDKMKKGE